MILYIIITILIILIIYTHRCKKYNNLFKSHEDAKSPNTTVKKLQSIKESMQNPIICEDKLRGLIKPAINELHMMINGEYTNFEKDICQGLTEKNELVNLLEETNQPNLFNQEASDMSMVEWDSYDEKKRNDPQMQINYLLHNIDKLIMKLNETPSTQVCYRGRIDFPKLERLANEMVTQACAGIPVDEDKKLYPYGLNDVLYPFDNNTTPYFRNKALSVEPMSGKEKLNKKFNNADDISHETYAYSDYVSNHYRGYGKPNQFARVQPVKSINGDLVLNREGMSADRKYFYPEDRPDVNNETGSSWTANANYQTPKYDTNDLKIDNVVQDAAVYESFHKPGSTLMDATFEGHAERDYLSGNNMGLENNIIGDIERYYTYRTQACNGKLLPNGPRYNQCLQPTKNMQSALNGNPYKMISNLSDSAFYK